jgi:polyisoprenyl-phosphate glycosyltransferase
VTSLVVLTPVFNDWESLAGMLRALDRVLSENQLEASVVVVDDGSTIPLKGQLDGAAYRRISRVEVLQLRRNLGHQRAIAIGLAFIHGERPCDAVVVMDADGQDRPEDVPLLLQKLQEGSGRTIVFAARMRRSESLLFRAGYHGYRAIHRALTGVSVRVGNFSIVPFWALGSLVVVSELWNHYSAAIFRSRLPYATIPTERGARLAGDSRMNFFSLVLHGMSALSVFADVIGVRLLVGATLLLGAVIASFVGVLLLRLGHGPGLATFVSGVALILAFQAAVVSGMLMFSILSARANLTFLPIRDYRHFVRDVSKVA